MVKRDGAFKELKIERNCLVHMFWFYIGVIIIIFIVEWVLTNKIKVFLYVIQFGLVIAVLVGLHVFINSYNLGEELTIFIREAGQIYFYLSFWDLMTEGALANSAGFKLFLFPVTIIAMLAMFFFVSYTVGNTRFKRLQLVFWILYIAPQTMILGARTVIILFILLFN